MTGAERALAGYAKSLPASDVRVKICHCDPAEPRPPSRVCQGSSGEPGLVWPELEGTQMVDELHPTLDSSRTRANPVYLIVAVVAVVGYFPLLSTSTNHDEPPADKNSPT